MNRHFTVSLSLTVLALMIVLVIIIFTLTVFFAASERSESRNGIYRHRLLLQ